MDRASLPLTGSASPHEPGFAQYRFDPGPQSAIDPRIGPGNIQTRQEIGFTNFDSSTTATPPRTPCPTSVTSSMRTTAPQDGHENPYFSSPPTGWQNMAGYGRPTQVRCFAQYQRNDLLTVSMIDVQYSVIWHCPPRTRQPSSLEYGGLFGISLWALNGRKVSSSFCMLLSGQKLMFV